MPPLRTVEACERHVVRKQRRAADRRHARRRMHLPPAKRPALAPQPLTRTVAQLPLDSFAIVGGGAGRRQGSRAVMLSAVLCCAARALKVERTSSEQSPTPVADTQPTPENAISDECGPAHHRGLRFNCHGGGHDREPLERPNTTMLWSGPQLLSAVRSVTVRRSTRSGEPPLAAYL